MCAHPSTTKIHFFSPAENAILSTVNISPRDDGVELISTREACIREMLARSSYCHTFKVEECLSACEKHGLPPTALPSIVEELNRRRADMDSSARMAHHIIEATMLAAVPEHPALEPQKRGLIVEVLLHIAYCLSPLIGILALVVVVCPYFVFVQFVGTHAHREGDFCIGAFALTVVFWIAFAMLLMVMPWKKLHPNREWLLAPIRLMRTAFRRLELATRPQG